MKIITQFSVALSCLLCFFIFGQVCGGDGQLFSELQIAMSLSKESRPTFLTLAAAVVGTAFATWQIQKRYQKTQAKWTKAKEEKCRSLAAKLAAEMHGKVISRPN